jgi:hypothetical protein
LVDYLVLTVLSTDGDTINSEQENNTWAKLLPHRA